jgi:anaerobic selenocysteine-containing dehydrogenase
VKPETEIYRLLAQRLGIPGERIAAHIPEPSDAAIDAWLEKKLEPFPGLSLERLRAGPVIAPGNEEVAFSERTFRTPSGRIELVSDEAVRRWGVARLPAYVEPQESVRRPSPESSRYPLYFMTPNTKNRIHSQFNNLRMIRAVSDRPRLTIHPDDAAARGIADGDRVRVRNDRGQLEVEARLERGIKPGCVSVTNGWWSTDGASVNLCSLGRETDMGHGAAFHDNLVEVDKAP